MDSDALLALTGQQLAAIVDSSDDAIVVKDLRGVIHSWSRGAERLFGYAAAEVIGKPVTVLIPPDREREEPYILRLIANGERLDHYQTVRCRKDGTLVDISLSVTPIRNLDGKIIGATKVARDVSDKRLIRTRQDLLAQAEQHLAAVTRFSEDAILSADCDGVIQSWNESAERIFGYSSDDAVGRPFGFLAPEGRRHEELSHLMSVIKDCQERQRQTVLRHLDGAEVNVLLRESPIRDSAGRVVGASVICRAIR